MSDFGGVSLLSTVELLDQLAAKATDPNQLDKWFDWEQYNKETEEIAAQGQEEAEKQQRKVMDSLNPDVVAATSLSMIVENLLTIDREPFSFKTREFMRGLYDLVEEYPNGCRNQLWHTARQVEKSTTQSAKSIALGIAVPAYRTLYVAPRFDQVTVFSQQRFKPMCEDSKELSNRWVNPPKTLWQVGAKQFLNGSFYNFRSCFLTADNSRGISAQHLMIDEIQDIVSDNVPILEQCQSHATLEFRYNSYAGTPKTNSNVITRRYLNSCQFEWLVRCTHCSHWTYQDDNMVGESFFECARCRKEIYPNRDGQWVPAKPENLDKCWGFRIPQTMVSFKTHAEIVKIRDDPQISRKQYWNECLGLPYDEGELVLVDRDLVEACGAGDGKPMWSPQEGMAMSRRGVPLFAGVDYGTAEGDSPSFTVLTIGFLNSSARFQIIYMEKFTGDKANLARQPAYLNEICRAYGVRWIGADWGFGAPLNARLVEEYGWPRYDAHEALLEMQYCKQKLSAAFNNQAQRYIIDRNQSMEYCIDAIRQKRIVFFNFEAFKPFLYDFTTIFIEFDDVTGNLKYDHTMPDDAFHAVNYAYMACRQFHGQLVVTALPDAGDQDGRYETY